jgi:PAS domain-containing protein
MEEGLTVYFQDITERRCAEESLRETKATLEFTLASAQIGDWDYDLERDESRRSLRHDQCFGYNEPIPRDKWNFNIFLEHVHPDDRASMVESFQAAVKTRRAWQDEYRVCWPDGTLHWISARGSFYRPKDGIPTRMLGIVVDITDRKQDELALQQANLELAKKAADLEKLIEQRSMA